MSSLRIISNLLKTNVKTKCLMQQQQQMWCGRPAVATACFSTIFSRNNGQIKINGGKELSRLSKEDIASCYYAGTVCNYGQKYRFSTKPTDLAKQSDSTKSAAITDTDLLGNTTNLSAFAKLKIMYKKYWYVAVPVHVVTSVGWISGFYYLSKR